MKKSFNEFQLGSTVLGTYRIDACFRSGGMGLVYRAAHLNWNMDLAIKHPRQELMQNSGAIETFRRECELWEEVGLHPNIVSFFYLRDIESIPCVVSEFVEGGSLADAIRVKSLYTGEDDAIVSRILTIAAQMAWGLEKAASIGLIHCDFKPGNVLLTPHGTAKVNDFGLAVLMRGASGAKAGGYTPLYASPEQLRGGALDTTTDIWSWAATVFELFTGAAIWSSGAAVGAAHEQFRDEGMKAHGFPKMPESLSNLIQSCLVSDHRNRLRSFREIAEEIQTIHEELFDEQCDAAEFDDDIVAADSLNNRAVSRFDLGQQEAVIKLLKEALEVDPLHPEANFNFALLTNLHGQALEACIKRLFELWRFDKQCIRALILASCLLRASGDTDTARRFEDTAKTECCQEEIHFMEHMLTAATNGALVPIHARPLSGEDVAMDMKRFMRLMEKAQAAFDIGNHEEVRRLLILSGDIDGLSRHPKRRALIAKSQL